MNTKNSNKKNFSPAKKNRTAKYELFDWSVNSESTSKNRASKNYDVLNAFEQRKGQCIPYLSTFYDNAVRQMEWTRTRNGLTCNEMAHLIGCSNPSYIRLVNSVLLPETNPRRASFTLPMFAAFCYIFGYDVSSVTELVQENVKVNNSMINLAASLTALDSDSFDKIAYVLNHSNLSHKSIQNTIVLAKQCIDASSELQTKTFQAEPVPKDVIAIADNVPDDIDEQIGKKRSSGKK